MYIGRIYEPGDLVGKSEAIYIKEAGKTNGKQQKRLIECICCLPGCENTFVAQEARLFGGYRSGCCDKHKSIHRIYNIGDKVKPSDATYVKEVDMLNGIRYIECICANEECNNHFIAPESKLYTGSYKGYCEQCRQKMSGIHQRKERIIGEPISAEKDSPIFLGYVENIKNPKHLKGKFLCGKCKSNTFERVLSDVENKRKQIYCSDCSKIESKGEKRVRLLLEELNISYKTQYVFPDLVSNKGAYLKFDFYLPDYNTCVEYDGEQHFSYTKPFFGAMSEEDFLEGKERDSLKNKYCKDNNIYLIRIPYYEKEQINEQYILDRLERRADLNGYNR